MPADPAPVRPEDPRNVRREVLAAAGPVVLQQTLRTLMFFVDTAMLGHYGAGALASMNIVGPVVFTAVSLLGALSIGAVATVSRAWGEGDRGRAEGEAATALATGVAAGVLAAGALWAVLPAAVAALAVAAPGGSAAAIAADADAYLRLMALSLPFVMLESVGSNVLRSCGDARSPFLIAAAANALNVAGNYAFIFGRWGASEMGVRGAALSTAGMFAFQGLAVAVVLAGGVSRVRVGAAAFRRITRDSLRRLARVSLPAAIEPLVLQSGFLVFTRAINALGPAAAAAHRVAVAAESLSFMPGYGFSIACGTLVGRRLGAGDPEGAAVRCRETLRLALIVMGALGVLFAAAPAAVAGLFIDDAMDGAPLVLAGAALCLAIGAFEQPALGTAMTLQGALRGAGDTWSPVAVAALGVWGVRVPLSILLTTTVPLGLAGIWITTAADWTLRAALSGWIYRRGRWKRKNL